MQSHLSTSKLECDGRTGTFNDLAARCFEHGLDARPLNVSVDWVSEYLLESLALCAVHSRMIAPTVHSAITRPDERRMARPCEA